MNASLQLKIVLEHCTTRDAINAVKECGPNVVGSKSTRSVCFLEDLLIIQIAITPHHLFLTIDDWADDPFCYW